MKQSEYLLLPTLFLTLSTIFIITCCVISWNHEKEIRIRDQQIRMYESRWKNRDSAANYYLKKYNELKEKYEK